MKKTLSLFFVIIFLTSCNSPTLDVTPTETFLPTLIPTPENSVTPTIQATKSPQEIAKALGFNIDKGRENRTYIEDERDGQKCILDTYNQACVATFNTQTNSWIEVDENTPDGAELKYGHLVPKDMIYIEQDIMIWSDSSKSYEVYAIYLGDISWDQETYDSKDYKGPVSMAYAKIGIRDEQGLHIAMYGMNAIKADETGFRFGYHMSPTTFSSKTYVTSNIQEVIDLLQPGDVFKLIIFPPRIYSESDVTIEVVDGALVPGIISNNSPDKLTLDEWELLAQGVWPDRKVELFATGNGIDFLTKNTPVIHP